jgi:hypothetical protein
MDNRINVKLNKIGRILDSIESSSPRVAKENVDRISRTILPTSKTRELNFLYEEILATQKLVDQLEDGAEYAVRQDELDKLEMRRREILRPEGIMTAEWLEQHA